MRVHPYFSRQNKSATFKTQLFTSLGIFDLG
nr:MAG TPA: hypothetical protein [Bacteriophage sp.]